MSKMLDVILKELVNAYQRNSIQATFMEKGSGTPGGVPSVRLDGMNVSHVQVKLLLLGSDSGSQAVKQYSGKYGTFSVGSPDMLRSGHGGSDNAPKGSSMTGMEYFKGNCKCQYLVSGLHMDKKTAKTKLKGKPGKLVWKGALAKYLTADYVLAEHLNSAGIDNLTFKDDPQGDCTVISHKHPIVAEVTTVEDTHGAGVSKNMRIPTPASLRAVDYLASRLRSL